MNLCLSVFILSGAQTRNLGVPGPFLRQPLAVGGTAERLEEVGSYGVPERAAAPALGCQPLELIPEKNKHPLI